MTVQRLLYLDENMPLRLAAELQARGRRAQTLHRDPEGSTLDRELIRTLAARHGPAVVLVTADERLPREHAEPLAASRLTVAIIAGARPDAPGDAYKREAVHRWAHLIATQAPGTVHRYSPRRQVRWRRAW